MSSNLIVKKPDELIKMRGEFSESALKLSTYLISILEKDKYIYEISVKEYLKKFDKTIGDFEKLYYTALELTKKQFKMVDRINKTFAIYNFFSRAKYKDGILTIKIDDELHQYLMLIKDNYLRYQIQNIMVLNSKYAIRIYEILKNKYEKTKKFKDEATLKMEVDELRKLLSIPRSYIYGMIKKRILQKSQEEINKKTDITFEFEEIKKGRKIVEIVFKIKLKSKPKRETEKKQMRYNNKDNLHSFRKKIIAQVDENKIILLDDNVYKIKNGFLYLNDEFLQREDAFTHWKKLYENRNKITIKSIDEIKTETFNDVEKKLNKIYKGKKTFISINGNYLNAIVDKIKLTKENKIKVYFKAENGKKYAIKYNNPESLKNL